MFLLAGNILFKGIDRFFRGIIGDSENSYWVFGNSCCFLVIRGFYCFFRILSCWDFGILGWKWVSGKGVAPAGWREMRTLLSIFPNPKHPENISQPSRKHITGFQKTLPTLQKTSSKVFRKNLTFIQKVSPKVSVKRITSQSLETNNREILIYKKRFKSRISESVLQILRILFESTS